MAKQNEADRATSIFSGQPQARMVAERESLGSQEQRMRSTAHSLVETLSMQLEKERQ